MVNVRGSVAQWERETIGERTATALRHKRAKGEVFNHAPLGYDAVDGALVPNAAELAICREDQARAGLGQVARPHRCGFERGRDQGKDGRPVLRLDHRQGLTRAPLPLTAACWRTFDGAVLCARGGRKRAQSCGAWSAS